MATDSECFVWTIAGLAACVAGPCLVNPTGGSYLANLRLGDSDDYAVDHLFDAPQSGNLAGIRNFWKAENGPNAGGGYAAGNGGLIRIEVRDDVTDQLMSERDWSPGLVAGEWPIAADEYQMVALNTLAPLVAGTRYKITYRNVSTPSTNGDAATNYISINHLQSWEGGDNVDPNYPGDKANPCGRYNWESVFTDLTESFYWPARNWIPCIELDIAGSSYGFGHMESFSGWNGEGDLHEITQTDYLRQRFSLTGDTDISEVYVLGAATGGTGGDMEIDLTDASGNVLATAVIPGGSFPLRANADQPFEDEWMMGTFSNSDTRSAGTYYLVMRSTGGLRFATIINRRGDDFGYHLDTLPLNGKAETSNNSGASWNDLTYYSGDVYPNADVSIYTDGCVY